MRNHDTSPQRQEFAIKLQPARMGRILERIPVQLGSQERLIRIRIGNRISHLSGAELRKTGELVSSSVRDGSGEITVEIAEKQERRRRSEFLPHKKEWR